MPTCISGLVGVLAGEQPNIPVPQALLPLEDGPGLLVFPHSEKQHFTPGERHCFGQRLGLCLSTREPSKLRKLHLLPAFPFFPERF